MIVVPALPSDLPALERLYRAAIDVMRDTPLDIWWEWGLHPTREGLEREIAQGNVLIALAGKASGNPGCSPADQADPNGRGAAASPASTPAPDAKPAGMRTPLGVMVLNAEQGAEYDQAPWPVDAAPEEVAVIHLFGIAPAARGKGVAKGMLTAAADIARQRGAKALRLDVFGNNAPAIALYRRCGFTDLGTFNLTVGGGLHHASRLMERAL